MLLSAWAEKEINQIIFDFVWSERNEQIKHEICHFPYELGILKAVNVALKCNALLPKSVVCITDADDQYKAQWVSLACYLIGCATHCTHCGVSLREMASRTPGWLLHITCLLLQLLRMSKMCSLRWWGNPWW